MRAVEELLNEGLITVADKNTKAGKGNGNKAAKRRGRSVAEAAKGRGRGVADAAKGRGKGRGNGRGKVVQGKDKMGWQMDGRKRWSQEWFNRTKAKGKGVCANGYRLGKNAQPSEHDDQAPVSNDDDDDHEDDEAPVSNDDEDDERMCDAFSGYETESEDEFGHKHTAKIAPCRDAPSSPEPAPGC